MMGFMLAVVFFMSIWSKVAGGRKHKPGRLTIHLGKRMYREILPDHQ